MVDNKNFFIIIQQLIKDNKKQIKFVEDNKFDKNHCSEKLHDSQVIKHNVWRQNIGVIVIWNFEHLNGLYQSPSDD